MLFGEGVWLWVIVSDESGNVWVFDSGFNVIFCIGGECLGSECFLLLVKVVLVGFEFVVFDDDGCFWFIGSCGFYGCFDLVRCLVEVWFLF